MSEHDIDFDFSPLGERFWRAAAEACAHKPSELQLRFACCLQDGLNATAAAVKAGYEGDESAIRVAGHRASKSTAVAELLSYARAETGKGDDGIVSGKEAKRILSRIARKGANNERVKSLEALSRLAAEEERRGESPEDDAYSGDRFIRSLLLLPNGASMAMLAQAGTSLSRMCLFHDMHHKLKEEPLGQTIWNHLYERHSDVMKDDIARVLGDLSWQSETRVQLWNEIGMKPMTAMEAASV